MQTLCEVRHQIILEILSDRLRLVVEDVLMFVCVDLVTLFCACMLLCLEDSLQVFLLLGCQDLADLFLRKLDFQLHSSGFLLLLVEGHVVVWFFILIRLDY